MGKGHGPRLHDLRHTNAVHALNGWVKADKDVYSLLPILSKFLGHEHIRSTEKYLRLTAEVFPDIIQKTSESCGYVIPTYRVGASIDKVGEQDAAY
jgi:integrase